MFNFLKPKKLPLLDPAQYPNIELAYQNKLWEGHPYFLSFSWKGNHKHFTALTSYEKDSLFFAIEHDAKNAKNLKLIGNNDNKLKQQYLSYLEISFFRILDNLKLRTEMLKKHWQSNEAEINPFLNQAEEQNYGWLEGTLNVLTRAIEQKIDQPEYLLQYEIQSNELEDESFLKIRCYNLFFNFSVRENQMHVMVIDSKDGQEGQQANRYDLVFVEQLPRVIDMLTKYFEYLRDNTKIDVTPI
jgi:hypothetical protein